MRNRKEEISAMGIGAIIIVAQLATPLTPAAIHPTASSALLASCPVIMTASNVAVAPNQPEVQPGSTVGIINALCDVTLYLVGCGFTPTEITLNCDANGDGTPELIIPLKNITLVNRALIQATLPALAPGLPGTAFPLACCGGPVTLTLTRFVAAGDDNVFGDFTQSQTCPIDLGIRAPVVISASPSGGDCALAQNLVISGSCFLLADGEPNVASVFAVEQNNPSNAISASRVVILNTNLISASFDFDKANAGKTFLIYASGPNGTSRNLTALPATSPADCPLGNEQGITVKFTCDARTGDSSPAPISDLIGCSLARSSSGSFRLILTGSFQEGGSVLIRAVSPKKVKLRDFNPAVNRFSTMILKGRLCHNLPGSIVYFPPDGGAASVLQCFEHCPN
jgi:hypothetical protein